MAQNLDWNAKESLAKKMTKEQLLGAYFDCIGTASVMGSGEMIGKDQAYYHDEASVYMRELNRRKAKAVKA